MTLQQQVIVKRKLQSFHGKYKLNKIKYECSGYYYHQLHRLAFSVLQYTKLEGFMQMWECWDGQVKLYMWNRLSASIIFQIQVFYPKWFRLSIVCERAVASCNIFFFMHKTSALIYSGLHQRQVLYSNSQMLPTISHRDKNYIYYTHSVYHKRPCNIV